MDETIVATYCLCDDLLKTLHHQEHQQGQMNDAEVMRLFAIIEANLKSFHTRLICAFVGCLHFADHTPSVGSA